MTRFIDYESVKKEMDALREGADKDGNKALADAVFFVERLIESRHTHSPEDVRVIPAQMIRDYHSQMTGQQIAEKWNIPLTIVNRILRERGVVWQHPESRRA